ncbi:RNA 2',3'-cyclic phosphodiesterase [Candidatus Woesearchaeota archaeon]|nr:RNA 2',3'-cyclic phosphodiesterase [Candidatus Woesearchaeota archaeon]
MRFFIAIQLPNEVKKHLKELQQKFTKTGKITFTQEQHLTLKFLGDITPAKAKQTEQKLTTIAFNQFTLKLSGIGFFPDEQNARVLWTGLQLNEDIIELQQKIDKALEKYFEKEKNFVPHITLGRIKTITDKKEFHKQAQGTKVKPLTFVVKEFQLIESELSSTGYEYKIIKEYSVKGVSN